LEYTPNHAYADYRKTQEIHENPQLSDGLVAVGYNIPKKFGRQFKQQPEKTKKTK